MVCADDKVRNPLTNRCVAIKGAVTKQLVQKHNKGLLKLDADDVEKLVTLGILKKKVRSPIPVQVKMQEKRQEPVPPVPSAPSAPIKVS